MDANFRFYDGYEITIRKVKYIIYTDSINEVTVKIEKFDEFYLSNESYCFVCEGNSFSALGRDIQFIRFGS